MTAALALLLLLAGSVVIVRIASVILRLTGLPDHVARFQSVSALTGAGFTTTESEAIVNFPIRRRVIVGLMALGNLGIVSVASTVIVALADSVGDADRMLLQIAQMVAALVVIFVLMLSKTVDRLLCGGAAYVLRRIMSAKSEEYDVRLSMGPDHCVAAHVYRGKNAISVHDLLGDLRGISVLAVIGMEYRVGGIDEDHTQVGRNETVVCFASIPKQRAIAERISALEQL